MTSDTRPIGDDTRHTQMERLFLVLGGHIYFQTLAAAVELDLFTLLGKRGPMTRAQLGATLGLEPKPLRILLLGCVTLGLIRREGDSYSNAPLSEQMLNREQPGNIVAIVRWQNHINYPAMRYFHEALRKNRNVGIKVFDGSEPTLYQRLTHHPELEQVFQDAMQAISVQANRLLAEHLDLSGVHHLVDVGGGDATNIISLARRFPHLKATVFDSPSVCDLARKNIREQGLEDRLGAVPGDCFVDPFPEADAVLFSHFFTIWSEQKNQQLLRKAYDALPTGGRAIIFNMMQNDTEDGPLAAALGSPYFLTLATGEGMLYTWTEYATWMREAGFDPVRTQALPTDHGVVTGVKA